MTVLELSLLGLVDCADGEHLGEVRAVLARRVDVGRRSRFAAAHGLAHGALPRPSSGWRQHGHGVDAAERDANAAVLEAAALDDAGAFDAERDRGEAVGAARPEP